MHRAEMLDVDAESYRLKEAAERAETRKRARKKRSPRTKTESTRTKRGTNP